MYNFPDHPDIARALCNGYAHPRPHYEEECSRCGSPAQCYGDNGFLCFDCARDDLRNLSDEDVMEALGYEVLYD